MRVNRQSAYEYIRQREAANAALVKVLAANNDDSRREYWCLFVQHEGNADMMKNEMLQIGSMYDNDMDNIQNAR
jgi:hypothetical protein